MVFSKVVFSAVTALPLNFLKLVTILSKTFDSVSQMKVNITEVVDSLDENQDKKYTVILSCAGAVYPGSDIYEFFINQNFSCDSVFIKNKEVVLKRAITETTEYGFYDAKDVDDEDEIEFSNENVWDDENAREKDSTSSSTPRKRTISFADEGVSTDDATSNKSLRLSEAKNTDE